MRVATRHSTSNVGDPLSVVAAVKAEQSHTRQLAVSHTRRLAIAGCAALSGYWAYGKASRGYAYVQLGAAATEQLFMQGLEGTVELELTQRPFSAAGELSGCLTPVARPPTHSSGQSHRSFSLIAHPPGHPRSKATADAQPLAPVPAVRLIGVLPPVRRGCSRMLADCNRRWQRLRPYVSRLQPYGQRLQPHFRARLHPVCEQRRRFGARPATASATTYSYT